MIHKKDEDCGLLAFERPDFCDELCEEFTPADLPEAGASAQHISSVVRSGATTGWISVKERLPEIKKKVIILNTYGEITDFCQAVIINKIDTRDYFDFDDEAVVRRIKRLNPEAEVFFVSAKTGEGFDKWTEWLDNQMNK